MAAELYRFADFELDQRAYQLRREGVVVHLQAIPFQLLCLLVERHGELVTREEILDRIWGKGVFIDSENSINTAVRKIRQALNDDADRPRFVVTVPAKGYRFVAAVTIQMAIANHPPSTHHRMQIMKTSIGRPSYQQTPMMPPRGSAVKRSPPVQDTG